MTQTTDGFMIAEKDLELRGPGEFFGTRQHGMPELKVANVIRDVELLQLARQEAFELLARNPQLTGTMEEGLRAAVESVFGRHVRLLSA
jgi:ATP-dependent DNA helicase RecG